MSQSPIKKKNENNDNSNKMLLELTNTVLIE